MIAPALIATVVLLGEDSHDANMAKYVLHVVADDLGYDDVGWRNGVAITPTLDALVAVGVELKEFYTYMECAPARGATMTGRYPMRLGVYTNNLAECMFIKPKHYSLVDSRQAACTHPTQQLTWIKQCCFRQCSRLGVGS